jgi:hypothetical protein
MELYFQSFMLFFGCNDYNNDEKEDDELCVPMLVKSSVRNINILSTNV